MFELDTALGQAFRSNSTKFQRETERSTLKRFWHRLIELLHIYISQADYGRALVCKSESI